MKELNDSEQTLTRRGFMTKTAAATVGAAMTPSIAHMMSAKNPDKLKIGLIGCGFRGSGAVMDCINANKNVELTAMADLFPEKIEWSLKFLGAPLKEPGHPMGAAQYGSLIVDWDQMDKIKVKPEHQFSGWDAYKKLIETDVDLVICGTSPYCRPLHILAAIKAGKHVFAEKPVAVDPVGVRTVIEATELAKKKGLAFVGGTQLRYSESYNEVIKRVHDGAIGDITSMEGYWWDSFTHMWNAFDRDLKWSDIEYQVRCWPHFQWTGGDHIVENLVHNIDVVNWVMGGAPKSASALGGHANWEDWRVKGNIYDHFYVEYSYDNDVKAHVSSRQIKNCPHRVGERIIGTKGVADPTGKITGENPYNYEGEFGNPRVPLWYDLVESIRKGSPVNHGDTFAESTMTAILGRMSAYTGRSISYGWALNRSQLSLLPEKLEFGPHTPQPLAIPGITELI